MTPQFVGGVGDGGEGVGDDVHALVAAYAVDAVDDAERSAFEEHLAGCEECRAEVAALRETASVLSSGVEAAPPASLRASVLAAVARTAQEPAEIRALDRAGETLAEPVVDPVAEPVAEPVVGPGPAAAPVAVDDLGAHRKHREQRSRWRYWTAGAVAAALVVIGGLVWRPWAPDELSPTDQVLQAADAQKFTQVVDEQPVTIVRSESLGRAVMVAESLPEIPADQTYELWLQDAAGAFVPAGLVPDPGGEPVTVELDGDAGTAKGAGLTVEPAGGSPQPTTDPLVLVAFG